MKRIAQSGFLLVLIVLASAMQGGYTGLQTTQATLTFTKTAGGGSGPYVLTDTRTNLPVVPNVGQASHWVQFCLPAALTSATLEMQASDVNATTFSAISEDAIATTAAPCVALEAGGYFPTVRVVATNVAGTNGTVANTSYSGSAAPIPGSGLLRGSKSSQPVTLPPAQSYSNLNLNATPAAVNTAAATVSSITIFNPNAGVVFITLSPVITTGGGNTSVVYGIAAGQPLTIPFPTGIQLGANSTVACSTGSGGAGNPATGCIVDIALKSFANIPSQVNASGTPQSSSTTVPN